MNPADLPQIGMSSSDLSLLTLFLQAHWIVKSVMIGLLVCSVWVWAIAIEKTLLHMRMRKAMDRFEQAFWSGQSLEELYRSLSAVAPGIAEALFATAIGLVAAIPATIFYNKFAAEVNKQAQRLEGFADEFSAILSRQIDERG